MESPLLLQLLMEKMGQERQKEEKKKTYCRCGFGKEYEMQTDSLDSISSEGGGGGGKRSTSTVTSDFLCSPLFDGAKHAIQLRAREKGWVKQEEDGSEVCMHCYCHRKEEQQQSRNNKKVRPCSTEWLSFWPQQENGEKDGDAVTLEEYTKYLQKILALTMEGEEREEVLKPTEQQQRFQQKEQQQQIPAVLEKVPDSKRNHQKDAFINTKDTFDIQFGTFHSFAGSYRSPHSIPRKGGTITQSNGLMNKIRSFKNRKGSSRRFPIDSIQFETIREVQTTEELSNQSESCNSSIYELGGSSSITTVSRNKNISNVLAAGPKTKKSFSSSISTSSPSFLFNNNNNNNNRSPDTIVYGLAS